MSNIEQQSSKAQDRTLGVWLSEIKMGRIKLPRFQRFEAWDRNRIQKFLQTILKNLPVGVTLTLDVDGNEKFVSRYISTAEPQNPEINHVKQNLLDGQQRLTALWRSLHNNYEKETYFVVVPKLGEITEIDEQSIDVFCQPRYVSANGKKMPLWADDPIQCFKKNYIPLDLLLPGDHSDKVDDWVEKAIENRKPLQTDSDAFQKFEEFNKINKNINKIIVKLKERVTHFNLPYLSLPSTTSNEVALQVFINMNTNSKPLSIYDIIVAQVDERAQKSLHDLEVQLRSKCPTAVRLGDSESLLLATSALLQLKLPNNRGINEMDKVKLVENWPLLEKGIERMGKLLDSQAIYDATRLPTNAVLAVVSALYCFIPETGDFKGKAEKLLRAYIWTAFLSERYDNSSASRAFADYKELKKLLENQQFNQGDINSVPIFDKVENPIVTEDELLSEGWPKSVGILSRGVLAIYNYFGAHDFADGQIANYESVQNREYHHVFPDALLKGTDVETSYLVLNCALITWKTNRVIGRKDPLDYLKERTELASEEEVKARLKTHLIPWEKLEVATYTDYESSITKEKIKNDFNDFLKSRAKLISYAIEKLVQGERPSLEEVWRKYNGE